MAAEAEGKTECPSEEDLARLIGASAEWEGLSGILSHLDSCETCRSLAATLAYRSALEPGRIDADSPSLPGVEPGTVVGRYVVLQQVGKGGMGVVFAAYDPTLDRKVAMKFVRSRDVGAGRVAEAERIAREALALARVSHPNVVSVHDGGSYGELAYLVMEYIEGQTLRGWLTARERPASETLAVLREAGEGLRAIHDAGLVHRDFKLENVMVAKDGQVRVTDFGLALEIEVALEHVPEFAGTWRYMAPEQLRRERVDARSDQYSFGVTAHEAVYGVHPFAQARSRSDLLALAQKRPDRGRGARGVPRSVERAIDRALAFNS